KVVSVVERGQRRWADLWCLKAEKVRLKVTTATETPGYALVRVAVDERSPDTVLKPGRPRELKSEDSVTVVANRITGELAIYIN
ncbi:hypothetical protein Pmar_PMAR022739, partial [Perkinsus marinus ATCC 50983]